MKSHSLVIKKRSELAKRSEVKSELGLMNAFQVEVPTLISVDDNDGFGRGVKIILVIFIELIYWDRDLSYLHFIPVRFTTGS